MATGSAFGFCGLAWTFCCFGVRVATAVFGASGALACFGVCGGATFFTSVSWNGAFSVVLGIALCSSVPLPCWFICAAKSAFSGAFSLLKVARVTSRLLLIWFGWGMEKPTPRSRATCRMAATNSVKPSRSAGRTPEDTGKSVKVAALIADRIGRAGRGSLPTGPKNVYDALRAASFSSIAVIRRSPMRVSKALSISRMQVGLVTLISVR
ncbi:hypothetical protein D9M71_250350 [compost metagenome]